MPIRITQFLGALAIVATGLAFVPGSALAKSEVQKECSEKYKAAKAANTLNGQTYNQYYKQCAAEAKTTPAAPPSAAPTTTAAPVKPPVAAPTPAAAPAKPVAPPPTTTAMPAKPSAPTSAPAPTMPVGNAVFPTAISPAHASDTPGKARRETCLDQYHANQATNGNGGLKWIEKGGGYYSECNKRLKG